MKQWKIKMTIVAVAIMAFFAIIGYVGDYDWAEQVILHMSQEEYDSVRHHLTEMKGGCQPSQREIAHWWYDHHND